MAVPVWFSLTAAVVAFGGAWLVGRYVLLRRARCLVQAAERMAHGDFASQVPLEQEAGTMGDLARNFGLIARKLEGGLRDRSEAEAMALDRDLRQTVVSALGQFATASGDVTSVLSQAVLLAGQTLHVEYCGMFELATESTELLLREGVGWEPWLIGELMPLQPGEDLSFTLESGEPVSFEKLESETRFRGCALLREHRVASGISVVVASGERTFGILGAYSTRPRRFTEHEVHFLLTVGSLAGMVLERTRTEKQLMKLADITRLNPTPTLEITKDGELVYCNQAAEALARAVGQEGAAGLLNPDVVRNTINCLVTGRDVRGLETRIGSRTLCWVLHPIMANQIVHAFVEDTTEKINLEAQLRQSQKMESVGQLAAGVAHDFNNLLTVIQGHSGMLLSGNHLPPGQRESAQAILLASEKAADLTRQLLTFSRKTVIERSLVDLTRVVGQIANMLRRLLGKNFTLEFTPPERLGLIEANVGMVEQVLMNLAVNARDAMAGGGTLTLGLSEVSISSDENPRHPQARPGRFICLTVSDTGCGMEEATLARIFEPFFTTKQPGKGTGLGLATVYGIVKQHEGWIDVTSQPGKGTRFHVYFPASDKVPEPEASAANAGAEVPQGTERVLVVEDEPALLEIARFMLEECGYEVCTANSGTEGLELWERSEHGFDLLLTDIVMPGGLSGLDLARRIRASHPGVRMLFTSGHALEEVQAELLAELQAGYLQKPYTLPRLAKAVRQQLDKE
jgi:signal transduction histidine kinase/ActR/RegA family two-component response regulator/HAMP domain-containing protein